MLFETLGMGKHTENLLLKIFGKIRGQVHGEEFGLR